MRPLDWVVLVTSLVSIVAYGLYRSRGSNTVDRYLLAGKTMPWYAMALSIMATQASAITFISTTGQSYVDGMRFVQFYFGLPIAMVIICATVVPRLPSRQSLHRVRVPGEALRRQDARAGQRHLPVPARPLRRAHHLRAGHRALRHPGLAGARHHAADGRHRGHLHRARRHQGGHLVGRAADVHHLLRAGGGAGHRHRAAAACRSPFGDAVFLAGAAGRLNAVTTHFDWNDRFNIWSGLIGGTFLFLSYFGCDQSQVQRYLTGSSIAQSRLSLLFNAVAKIPMQFFILFIGAMVFVFYLFVQPPLLFQQAELAAHRRRRREYPARGRAITSAPSSSAAQAALALVEAHHARRCRRRDARAWPTTARRSASSTARAPAPRTWWRAPAARRASATPTTSSCRS